MEDVVVGMTVAEDGWEVIVEYKNGNIDDIPILILLYHYLDSPYLKSLALPSWCWEKMVVSGVEG